MTTEAWPVAWHIEHATREDVDYAAKEGRTLVEGQELWRIATAIGPLQPDHSHWGGGHIHASREEIAMAAAAPVMAAALRAAVDSEPGWTEKARAALALLNPPEPSSSAVEDFI